MTDKTLPEEKLLKVIQEEEKKSKHSEESKDKPAPAAETAEERGHIPKGRIPSLHEPKTTGYGRIKNIFSFFGKKEDSAHPSDVEIAPSGLGTFMETIDIRILNIIFASICALFLAFVISSHFLRAGSMVKINALLSKTDFFPMSKKIITELAPLDTYLETIKERNVFSQTAAVAQNSAQTPATSAVPAKAEKEDINKIISDLKLVGIFWGSPPEAMIKSTKDNQTYFLKMGDVVGDTAVVVKTIFKDKVVVAYKDKEAELR